jgi:hypothetical protein
LQSQAEGYATFRVWCIVSEQPCLKLAAGCSWFVQNVKRRSASQRFVAVCFELSKGLVNQEMQNARLRAQSLGVCLGFHTLQ